MNATKRNYYLLVYFLKSLLSPILTYRRLAVINDAIKQVKLGIHKPISSYGVLTFPCTVERELNRLPIDFQLQPFLKDLTPQEPCQVCARGSLFLSLVTKENHWNILDYKTRDVNDKLRDLWSTRQINEIEVFFEQWHAEDGFIDISDDKQRLLEILHNMRNHMGLFNKRIY